MSTSISIPTELKQKIAERAASRALPLEEYVREVLRRDAEASLLDEILAPVREQFAASGVTEEELDAFVETRGKPFGTTSKRRSLESSTIPAVAFDSIFVQAVAYDE